MTDRPMLAPEDDPALLRAELDACRAEIARLRARNSDNARTIGKLRADLAEAREPKNRYGRAIKDATGGNVGEAL